MLHDCLSIRSIIQLMLYRFLVIRFPGYIPLSLLQPFDKGLSINAKMANGGGRSS